MEEACRSFGSGHSAGGDGGHPGGVPGFIAAVDLLSGFAWRPVEGTWEVASGGGAKLPVCLPSCLDSEDGPGLVVDVIGGLTNNGATEQADKQVREVERDKMHEIGPEAGGQRKCPPYPGENAGLRDAHLQTNPLVAHTSPTTVTWWRFTTYSAQISAGV